MSVIKEEIVTTTKPLLLNKDGLVSLDIFEGFYQNNWNRGTHSLTKGRGKCLGFYKAGFATFEYRIETLGVHHLKDYHS